MSSSSESALTKPFRSIYRFVGAIVDAVYFFFSTLISPDQGRYSNGRLTNSGNSGRSTGTGSNVRTLRPHGSGGGNAPNMSIGGCRTCQ
ncbi:hypothetical protein TKK_0013991 [Trichogramma kaykai]